MTTSSLPNPARYRITKPGQREGIRYHLYDSLAYAAAGQQLLTFFQNPVGSVIGGTARTYADTNMKVGSMLPQGNTFVVEGVEFLFFPGVLPGINAAAAAATEFTNDVYTVQKSGWIEFNYLDKKYIQEGPIGRFPSKSRLEVSAAYASTVAASQLSMDYASFTGQPWRADPPFTIEPNTNFSLTANWPALVPLPSGQAGRLVAVMSGVLIRSVQ